MMVVSILDRSGNQQTLHIETLQQIHDDGGSMLDRSGNLQTLHIETLQQIHDDGGIYVG